MKESVTGSRKKARTLWESWEQEKGSFERPSMSIVQNLTHLQRAELSGPRKFRRRKPTPQRVGAFTLIELLVVIRGVEPSWAVGDAKSDTTTSNLQRGVLFPYNHTAGIYRCPADKTSVEGHPGLRRTRTYQLCGRLNYTDNGAESGPWYPDPRSLKRKVSDLASPSQVFTFIDSHPETGDGAEFLIQVKEAGGMDAWAARPGEQHNLGANAAFADGHVTHWRWRWSRKHLKGASRTPVNAADRADFQLVKDHWPYP
jgi:prepilin-type processing-associated H-X9-DG protein